MNRETRHYFSKNWDQIDRSWTIPYRFSGKQYLFQTAKGIFSRRSVDAGTDLLIENAFGRRPTGWILDLGCGYGPVGVVLARTFPDCRVVMVDINFLAVRLARWNTEANGAKAHFACCDGLEAFRGIPFNLIVANPPLRAGKDEVLRLLSQGIDSLGPGGELLFVARTRQGALSLKTSLALHGAEVSETGKGSGYRVFRAVSQRRTSFGGHERPSP